MNSSRKPSVSIHRRILLVFLISIALPGAYLGYVGLRSIVQEQELQQALLVQNAGRALEFEIDRIERRIEESEGNIARDLVTSTALCGPTGWIVGSTQPPWIEHVFTFDSRLRLRCPLPFSAEQPPSIKGAVEETSLRNKLESATRLELQGNQAGALAAYRQLLPEAQSLRSRIVLNTYIARTAATTGNRDVARGAYEAIVRADPTFLVSQPIPYAAFAWLESADNLAKQGDVSGALEGSLNFYQRFLNFYHRFSPGQFSYLSHRIHAQIDACAGGLKADTGIRARVGRLEEQERLLNSTLSRAEAINSWLQAQRQVLSVQDSAGAISHHSFGIGNHPTSLSLILVGRTSGPRHWVVLVLRPEEVQREFVLPLLLSSDLAHGFDVAIRPDSLFIDGQMRLASSPMNKTAPLFPSTVVSVAGRQASAVTIFGVQISLLSAGFGIFAVGIVLLGIFIIYHDIRREEELSRMKSEFISNVSHELKTPIAAIRILSDNLRQRRVEEEPRKMEYFQLISKESARLSHLIDNILDFSRVEGKRKIFRLEPCDVAAVVNETVRQFRSLLDEQSPTIQASLHERLPEVMADPDALALAVFNLLDNAVKYSEKKSQIDVSLYKDDSSLCIEVTDHGVGIPREDQAKIFEKFYRVQRIDGKKIPGSGIGLTLVREIAEAHKGRVELVSETGAGSTFRIKLPIGG